MNKYSVPSFENLVESRIGFGRYQKILIFLMSFVIMADGVELSALSLILPILKSEWSLSPAVQALMGSILFIGLLVGSIFNGFLTDKFGRQKSLSYISMIQFLLSIYSALVYNEIIFLIVRGIFGILLGFVVPLVPALVAEWTPMEKRGKVIVIVTSMFSVGQFAAILVAQFCLENLGKGNWRLMLVICSFPSFLVWLGCFLFLQESPRFSIMNDNTEAGFKTLNHVIIFNKLPQENLFGSEQDLRDFQVWRDFIHREFDLHHDSNLVSKKLKEIFDRKYYKITLGIWAAWFGINFAAYGLVFIMPFFLESLDNESIMAHGSQNGLLVMMFATIGEASSGILAYLVVDVPNLGRKNSLALSQVITAVCALVSFGISIKNTVVVICILAMARFFAKVCFTFIYPLTAEIYPTTSRTMGLGSASAFGRLSAVVMPFVLLEIFYMNIYYPFLMIFIFSLMGLVGTFMVPHDTTGRCLDTVEPNDFEGGFEMQIKEGFLSNGTDEK